MNQSITYLGDLHKLLCVTNITQVTLHPYFPPGLGSVIAHDTHNSYPKVLKHSINKVTTARQHTKTENKQYNPKVPSFPGYTTPGDHRPTIPTPPQPRAILVLPTPSPQPRSTSSKIWTHTHTYIYGISPRSLISGGHNKGHFPIRPTLQF